MVVKADACCCTWLAQLLRWSQLSLMLYNLHVELACKWVIAAYISDSVTTVCKQNNKLESRLSFADYNWLLCNLMCIFYADSVYVETSKVFCIILAQYLVYFCDIRCNNRNWFSCIYKIVTPDAVLIWCFNWLLLWCLDFAT